MPYPTHETKLIQKHYIGVVDDDDMDLCQMLETLKLNEKRIENVTYNVSENQPNIEDEIMSGRDCTFGSNTKQPPSPSPEPLEQDFPHGCAYLRAIRHQLEWGGYTTTGGEYLDAIFTHREILFSQPTAHQDCARAFTDLAGMLEKRAWRSDRDADTEAVVAFRHEAWVIASM